MGYNAFSSCCCLELVLCQLFGVVFTTKHSRSAHAYFAVILCYVALFFFLRLMAALNLSFDSATPVPDVTWTTNKTCVVRRSVDSKWYRAQIVEVNVETSMVKASV